MNIKIVRRPIGEAPEWVRDAWIGLSLPLAFKRERGWQSFGVLSGPNRRFPQLWALVIGKASKVEGYLVNAQVAVDRLTKVNPEAAAWWRKQTPELLNGKHCFIFDVNAGEREPMFTETTTGDCRHCGHAIGYHHAGTEDQMLCTAKNCNCPGYDDEALP